MRNKNFQSLILILLIMLLCFSPSFLLTDAKKFSIIQQPNFNQVTFEDEENYVQLPYLPVDIDEVFWADNLTRQREHLNLIGNGTNAWILPSWGGCFVSQHTEGADK